MTTKGIFTASTLVFLATAPDLHAAGCSNAFLKGTYAYSASGFVEVTRDISPAGFVPYSQAGLTTYDGNGNITSGTWTIMSTTNSGLAPTGEFAGSYSVNPDCSGKLVITVDGTPVFSFDLVVKGPRAHMYINTDPLGFISIYSFEKIRAPETE